tara:strand:+ start:2914 stop:3087 length:174 start_codon:yes stop_codon:yes gene_type:complete
MDKLSKPVFNDEEYESFLRLMKYVNDLNNNVIGFNEPYLKDLEIINRFITAHGQYKI